MTIGGRRGSVEELGLVGLGNYSSIPEMIGFEYQSVRWVYIEGGFIIYDGITTEFHRNQTCVLGGQN